MTVRGTLSEAEAESRVIVEGGVIAQFAPYFMHTKFSFSSFALLKSNLILYIVSISLHLNLQ